MSKRFSKGPAKGPSQRQLRVGELVRHAVSAILSRGDIQDPAVTESLVTVSEVRMSPDLKLATCYITPFGGGDAGPLVKALNRHTRFVRGAVAHEVALKFAPDIRFREDTRFDTALRIDALLHSPDVRRDLEARPDTGDDDEGDAQ